MAGSFGENEVARHAAPCERRRRERLTPRPSARAWVYDEKNAPS